MKKNNIRKNSVAVLLVILLLLSGCGVKGQSGSGTAAKTDEILTEVNMPLLQRAAQAMFQNCKALTEISLPAVKNIGYSVFQNCSKLEEVNLPEVTYLEGAVFYQCSNLAMISLPKATSIGSGIFKGCPVLSEVNLPEVTSVGSEAFENCASLAEIYLPKAVSIGNYAFCSSGLGTPNNRVLKKVTLDAVETLGSDIFYGCYGVEKLIIRTPDKVCILGSQRSGSGVRMPETYVPDELVDSYKEANVWSTIADHIHGLSELTEE